MRARTVALLTAGAVLLAALGASLAVVTSETVPPAGDQAVAYRGAVIDVPTTWKVTFDNTCPTRGPGLVSVGEAAQAANLGCPPATSKGTPVNWVWFATGMPAVKLASPRYRPMTVHTLRVYRFKTHQPAPMLWVVPSLDVGIRASGPTSSRILRSLHRG